MRAKTFNTNGPEDGREEIVQPSTSLLRDLVRKKDFYSGGLMILSASASPLKGRPTGLAV